MDTFEFKLRHPYKSPVGTKQLIETVSMRLLLTVDDMIAANKLSTNTTEQTRVLVARCCGLLPEELGPMALKDYGKLDRRLSAELQDEDDPKGE